MKQEFTEIKVSTNGKGLIDVTEKIKAWAEKFGFHTGLLTLFVAHTSASLLIQENADPDVLHDMERFFSKLVPENDPDYRHTTEGSDDMPAHIRSALTQTQLSIPLRNHRLALGVWQGLYLYEHRRAPHTRTLLLHLIGE
ncbi:MAG: YjbQ family protein [Candidatus Nitrohelix vancouverensis]|uniref:YjbQ family protein n=1 Tax=Candidatus Nitrohelix vancouverensis TaxID=2705534 RepID=A0A7T0C1I9_9BACT|nr:MAG: YjbQ family protein [Candidatus Nitrohelix vancouverensis]